MKNKKYSLIVSFLLPTLLSCPALSQSLDETELSIKKSDLVFNKPVTRSEEGMPVGNGKMGSLVWTTPSSLKLQINRVDIFGNNSASDSFFERNTDYCSGAGFVDVEFMSWKPVFSTPGFQQHLSCYDGIITTDGINVKTTTIAWHEKDVMAIHIEDQREEPMPVVIRLRMLRDTVVRRGGHTAISRLKTIDNRIILTQEFKEGTYFCGSSLMIGIEGRESRTMTGANNELQLIVKPGKDHFTVYISTAASFDSKRDLVIAAADQLASAIQTGFENILASNRSWWSSFWDRSWVHLHSNDGEADLIEENYNYFMYVMASSSRGSFPPKFNGMIWTTAGDARKWGNNYWGANQSCLYNGLFPSNRMEIIDPMFMMYTGMMGSLEKAAIQQWGSKGIYIPETVAFDGLPELPDEIAKEMRDIYLARKPWSDRSASFVDYASSKSPFSSRWNWKQDTGWRDGKWTFTDKGNGAFGHVTHIFSRGAKIGYQYWQRFEYTGDTAWLRSIGYPMIRGVAEFYRNFPNLKKEKDGMYHINFVNDNESVRGGHNTVEEISSMMGILPVAIKASEILGIDKDMKALWKELLENLSPLPLNTDYPDSYKPGSPVTFARALPPVLAGPGSGRPDPNTMPVWFFDLCNPIAGNSDMVKTANATFDSYFPNGLNEKTKVFVLSKLAVAGTVLWRKEAARYLIPNQIRTAEIETMPNRMTLREGYQTTGVQNLGRMADALHNALCQSSPAGPGQEAVIKLFPAWPEEWKASFKLLCRGNFLVTSSCINGVVGSVEILSQSGGVCRVINPWEGKSITLSRNGKKEGKRSGELLVIDTRKNDRINILRVN